MNYIETKKIKLRTKRVFLKQGTCSRTFFYLLNREFGHPKEMEECAIDPLAGGILQQGYQCGMLWGASMAVGAESLRKSENLDQAIALSISATQHLMESFANRTKSIECSDITNCDMTSKWGLMKFFFMGKPFSCLNLAEKWAPEAIKAAKEGLSKEQSPLKHQTISCASEVVKKMGGSDEEMAMVAGFAGGLGLSGSGCGALVAAIWMTILELVRKEEWKSSLSDPDSDRIINKFYGVTDYEIECHKICGKHFTTIDDHSAFIKNGGCDKLIDALSNI